MDVEPVGGEPGEVAEVALLEMLTGEPSHRGMVAAHARQEHFRMVEGEIDDRYLSPTQGLHERHDFRIVPERHEYAVAVPALGLTGDTVENRQLPAVLPGIARDPREPRLVGGRDQYEYVSAFHAGDYTTSGVDTII